MNESERAAFHPEFERALGFATRLHARQVRKGTAIPYISHLLAVASLVLEYGGGRDEAIAGLLHDAIEDCPRDYPGQVGALRRDIESEFGSAVLAIVEGCTDTDVFSKPDWRDRKERYIAHVREASGLVRLVSCADKLHNSRSIVADLRVHGDALFARFKGGREGTLWYYTALAAVFTELGPGELAAELQRTVDTMNTLAA